MTRSGSRRGQPSSCSRTEPRSRPRTCGATAPPSWRRSRSRSGSRWPRHSRGRLRGSCFAARSADSRGASVASPAMAKDIFYDADADLALLDGKTVAILGYGSQGHAHALNLKDSGATVVVGLRPDSSSRKAAEGHGLEVLDVADAASRGDIVMVLLPDEKQADIWESDIADGIAEGNLLMFAHGFAIHFDQIKPPPGVDIGMVAPKGPGHLVRRQYEEGAGVPCLMAVHQDATGKAHALVLAYAAGIGGGRGGI